MTCPQCTFDACACKYTDELLAGKHGEHILAAAITQMELPQPHRGGCPCPACWSTRAADWEAWVIEMNKKGKL